MLTRDSSMVISSGQIFNENGGFVRELPQDPLNSGLGITLICPAWHINL